MILNDGLKNFIVTYQNSLLELDLIRELFMIPERLEAAYEYQLGEDHHLTLITQAPLYKGKLLIANDKFYAITSFEKDLSYTPNEENNKRYNVITQETAIPYQRQESTPLATPQDTFILYPGQIENYTDTNPIETSLGRFIANYCFLVYPFGSVIPYHNEEFTVSILEKKISKALLNNAITVQQIKERYINSLSLFGNSPDILAPNITEKTITIPKHITDLREKLIAEHKVALDAGDVSVMTDIEQQLISAYKDYLKGDPSLHFLLKKKFFNVALKKLFLTHGIVEKFGESGKFTFIDNPMSSGWKQENLPDIFNEVRSGSYSRAIETADGGVVAKLILRVFQDTRLDTKDCETKLGQKVFATKENLKDYLYNYVVNPDGTTTLIEESSLSQFIGREIVIRTPGYCKATKGFCAKCFGYLFEELGQKAFAPIANDLARVFTVSALKKMHGTNHSTVKITDLNKYLIK